MLVAVDVGNTQTVIGVFADDGASGAGGSSDPRRNAGELPGLVHHWRVATVADRTSDELALLLSSLLGLVGLRLGGDDRSVTGLVVSSSVPSVTATFREMGHTRFDGPFVVIEPGVRTGVPILYDNPKEVGADRIANAVGALDLYGGPCIIVDLGTATTFDAISPDGAYMGGAITPGIDISLDALFGHAAALRRVELVEPRNVIGRSTVESIQSGAIYGNVAMVDGLCRRIADAIGVARPAVIATGGLASLIAPLSETIEYHEPWLTLHGLRLVYERNTAPDNHHPRPATRGANQE
jgi:type III pantothenate kinase